MQDTVENIWNMAYGAFEKRPLSVFRSVSSSSTQNEIQFRMMKMLANLKIDPGDHEIISQVRGDVLVCESMGIFAPDTAEKIQVELDKLEEK